MLRVFKASGEEALAIKFQEFLEIASSQEPGQPVRVRAVMRHLQRLSGLTRFKQRLLVDTQMLWDDDLLDRPFEAQLVVLPFQETSQDQIKQLLQATKRSNIPEMERLLQTPQDPDLQLPGSRPALHVACGRWVSIEAVRLLSCCWRPRLTRTLLPQLIMAEVPCTWPRNMAAQKSSGC